MTNYGIEFNPIFKRDHIAHEMPHDFVSMFSGKSAIAAVMQYLRKEDILKDKTDQILVPWWMGSWIYMTLQKYCTTTPIYTPQTKAIFVYHQFGFPQNMSTIMNFAKDKDLVVIEDCAHAIRSFYKGRRVGEFGLAGIFSFSKFFDCIVGGGLCSDEIELEIFVQNLQEENHNEQLENQIVKQRKIYNELPRKLRTEWRIDQHYAVYDHVYKMPELSKDLINSQLADGMLERRKQIYQNYYEAFNDVYWDEEIMPIPWAMPLFNIGYGASMVAVADELEKEKIESGIYHFDINRNLLDPNFQKCLLLPCHHHMTDNDVDKVIEIVKEGLG